MSLALVAVVLLVRGPAAPSASFASMPQAQQPERPQALGDVFARSAVLRGGVLPMALLPFAASVGAKVGGEAVTLKSKLTFPVASFGLQIYDDKTAEELTKTAISVGYRNFFASVLAGNQQGFARGVAASGVPREELFICGSVLSNRARGFDSAYQLTKRGNKENLNAFAVGGITYVDQIMLDYPGPDCDSIRGQWKAFEEMLAAGQTKSLAVSNFSPQQLDCILSDPSATVPDVNQLPFYVGNYDPSAVEENRKRGILVQAWSPLGAGRITGRARAACTQIGEAKGKSFAQVALRWIYQKGATFSTQTRKREHFVEDLSIFDFELSQSEMDRLDALNSRR